MPDRAARPGAEPSGDEIEITPEMIEAGRSAYYKVARYRGDEPFDDEMAVRVFREMVSVMRPRLSLYQK